jgi:Protein of unknown function (DUF1761)
MKTLKINLLAVLVCVVAGQILPMIWYVVLNDQWLAAANMTAEQSQNVNPIAYGVSIIAAAAAAYLMAWLFTKIPVESAQSGFLTGLLLGTGFIFLEIITQDMFQFKPLALSLINGGQTVLVYAVMGLVLGAWRKYES